MSFMDGVAGASIRDQKRMNYMSTRRRQGKPKPFKSCEECLFIKDHCVMCKVEEGGKKFPLPEGFVDWTLMHPDVVTESIIGSIDSVSDIMSQTKSTPHTRRNVTQIRDGCST